MKTEQGFIISQPEGVTELQAIYLELLSRARFNNLDGERIVDDLLKNRHLWRAVMLSKVWPQLVTLRDMHTGFYHEDTLYIYAVDKIAAQELVQLGQHWDADDVRLLEPEEVSELMGTSEGNRYQIIKVWWD